MSKLLITAETTLLWPDDHHASTHTRLPMTTCNKIRFVLGLLFARGRHPPVVTTPQLLYSDCIRGPWPTTVASDDSLHQARASFMLVNVRLGSTADLVRVVYILLMMPRDGTCHLTQATPSEAAVQCRAAHYTHRKP